jgi:hypothetical protein
MSKLIGTNPNQVPSNADLGTAAFMDKKEFLLSKGSSLSAIDAIVPKTAVDVFVYDTSKDSDGGAWRKRTQHTSWYNEKLNTTTRGSRREFPAVSVIVVESSKVTIYDGDDPRLPMWMVFNGGNDVRMVGSAPTAAVLRDGALWVSLDGWGVSEISFIKEVAWRHRNNVNSNYYGKFHGVIVDRNVDSTFSKSDYIGALVNGHCRDIAITVLSNAPIDADTGLPVPTIGVGTSTGLSIIKDDGTVINRTTSFVNSSTPGGVHDISFDNNNGYWYTNCHYPPTSSATSHAAVLGHSPSINTTGVLSSSDGQNYEEMMMAIGSDDGGTTTHWSTATMPGVWMNANQYPPEANAGYMEITPHGDFANRYGLHKFLPNYTDHSASAVAYVASDYNTGYMVGRTKLATLSDTSTTNAVSTDVLGGIGNFTDANAWTIPSGWSLSSNIATGSGVTAYLLPASNGILTVGKQYAVTVTQSSYTSGTVYMYVGTGAPNGYYYASLPSTTGTYTFTLTAYNTNFGIYGANYTGVIDNVTISLAEEDRSIRGKGLQVFGTVTKTAVATGADLVGYSGFSSSNYLQQPYNSNLDFGTGDFSVVGWINPTTSTAHHGIVNRMDSGGGAGFLLEHRIGGTILLQTDDGTTVSNLFSTSAPLGQWTQFCCTVTNSGTKLEWFMNGVSVTSALVTARNVTNTAAVLRIGEKVTESRPMDGSLALLRVSATAPSPEQIKKMYNDEKPLFQEGAQATLYGTSDAVTALAYDDDTNLLHVGTSAGRSEFQGLNRVNNTTDAVGAAISASNGFIVED